MSYPTNSIGEFLECLSIGIILWIIVYLVLGGALDSIFYIIWLVVSR